MGSGPALALTQVSVAQETGMDPKPTTTVGTGVQGSSMSLHVLCQMMLQLESLIADAAAKRPEAEGQHDVAVTFGLHCKPFPTQATEALSVSRRCAA